jgi:hypothetical protein
VAFVNAASVKAGCVQMTEPESFLRHLRKLRDKELPETSLLLP